jgi:GTP cyclohydrolase I
MHAQKAFVFAVPSAMCGVFAQDAHTRQEFMSLIQRPSPLR